MNNNVLPFQQDLPKPSKRRNNLVVDMNIYKGSGAKLSWDEAVEIYIRAKQAETDSARTIDFGKRKLK